MNTFQIVLLSVFGFFILGALILFATVKGTSNGTIPIVLWGTVPKSDFTQAVDSFNTATGSKLAITYVEKREDTFDQDLIQALADRKGPDAVLLPQDMIIRYQSKIAFIPYTSFSARDFQNTFIDEAGLYSTNQGTIAFPFSVDPLVMYWNKDTFFGAGVALPPQTWDQFYNIATKFTQKDKAGNIVQSGLALGEYSNITHAKEIISALLMQAGTPIVNTDNLGNYRSALSDSPANTTPPAESALRFYTEFSNPAKTDYSWNRSLDDSLNMFAAGDLAVYFGLASDYASIKEKNPNLNFDIATLPQPLGATKKITYGKMNAFAVLNSSGNVNGTFQTLNSLFGSQFASTWATTEKIAPARKDLLVVKQSDAANQQVYYNSALISQGWLDPNMPQSNMVFEQMIDGITSGADTISAAVLNASQQLQGLIKSQ